MNYQAPSGATWWPPAENIPLLTELFCLVGAILQICRAAGALTGRQRQQRAELRRQFFAVRQMTGGRPQGPVPARRGRVAGVFKQQLQRRRFDVAVAKDRVGFADEFKESVN